MVIGKVAVYADKISAAEIRRRYVNGDGRRRYGDIRPSDTRYVSDTAQKWNLLLPPPRLRSGSLVHVAINDHITRRKRDCENRAILNF